MNTICFVQNAVLDATPPLGTWHAHECPNAPLWSLVVVEWFQDAQAEATFLGLAGVVALPEPWEWAGKTVPTQVATALADWGVTTADTVGSALRKVRQFFPLARMWRPGRRG